MPPLRNPELLRKLENLLIDECRLYESYIIVLNEERGVLPRFNSEQLNKLSAKREDLYSKIEAANQRRLKVMQEFPNSENRKLSEIVSTELASEDSRRILLLIGKLKNLVQATKRTSNDSSQLVSFAMNLLHGTMSIFNSANQNVTRGYSRKGMLKETWQPSGTRQGAVRKEV